MSYRNPQQVVDTQTGQHYRNLQKTISSTFGAVAKNYSEEQEKKRLKLLKDAKASQELKNKIENNGIQKKLEINKVLLNNPLISQSATGIIQQQKDIDMYSVLKEQKSPRTPEEKVFMANVELAPVALKKFLTTMGSYLINSEKELGKNLGKMGGAAEFQSQDYPNFAAAFLNLAPADRKLSIDNTQEGGPVVTVTMNVDGKDISINSTMIEQLQGYDSKGIYEVIPDVSEDAKESVLALLGDEKGSNKGFKQKYLKKSVPEVKGGYEITYQPVDQKAFKSDLSTSAQSTINSLTKNESVSLYNFFAKNKEGFIPVDYSSQGLNDEQKKELLKDYIDYSYDNFAGGQSRVEIGRRRLREDDGTLSSSESSAQKKAQDLELYSGEVLRAIEENKLEDTLKALNISTNNVITSTGDEKGDITGYFLKKGSNEYRFKSTDSDIDTFKKLMEIKGYGKADIQKEVDKLFNLDEKTKTTSNITAAQFNK